ncbi:ABC transporter permease [Bacilliculturomica massiliensis]|uniref:ABC transporter permease n=1 Tax=Bacilliculturomica massiliensis TaxID=1917867 RepID=UPI0010306BB3|nr:ABC transporter permease [Bacilliculturomica massiliensis]
MREKTEFSLLLVRAALIAAALAFWQYAAVSGMVSAYYTSYPTEILLDLIDFAQSGALWKHASVTLSEALMGLFYGTVTGIFTGVLFGQFKRLGKVFLPIVTAIHGVPQLTLAPVYILWFGLGFTSKVFLASLMVFFNVFFATFGAVNSMEKKLVESATLLGAGKVQTLWHVVLPSCSPWILTGIRNGLGSSLVGAIIGEYMGAAAGFGWMIAYATSYFNIKRVMSCIVILLLVGVIMNFSLDKAEQRLFIWRPKGALDIGPKSNS